MFITKSLLLNLHNYIELESNKQVRLSQENNGISDIIKSSHHKISTTVLLCNIHIYVNARVQ